MINQTAQGLASLGRHGDSMLMHVSPAEVSGLQALGQMTGHKLHTNPHTGLPEAFDFGDFFTSFLPTIVGAAVGGPAGAGFMSSTLTPILAGAGTGALLAKAKGDDPLMGAFTGGLGGYGGSGLGQTFSKAFGSTGTNAAVNAADDVLAAGAQQTVGGAGNVGMFTPGNMGSGAGVGPQTAFGQAGTYAQAAPNLGVTANTPNPFTGAGGFDSAAKTVAGGGGYSTAPLDVASSNLSNVGTGVKNLSGLNPDMSISDAYGAFTKAGGTASDLLMPVGTGVLAGLEPSDIYGKPYSPGDKDKYDPYATLNLNNDTGLRLIAKGGAINSYALGGAVRPNPSVGGGLSDLYNRAEGATTQNISSDGYGIGRLNNLAGEQSMTQAQTLGYADGGNIGMNVDRLPTLNLETGKQSSGMGDRPGGLFGALLDKNPDFAKQLGISGNTAPPQFGGLLGAIFKDNPDLIKQLGMQGSQYARGGYLNGDGDGMSDSIPATIEGKQPARLADGEFVIPADVVSHLGNGSSKAGSKRLYDMLDKVRHARTGNKKQGKQIKADKYLPA